MKIPVKYYRRWSEEEIRYFTQSTSGLSPENYEFLKKQIIDSTYSYHDSRGNLIVYEVIAL